MPDEPRSRPPAEDRASGDGGNRPWIPPALEELPPLTDLTLQSVEDGAIQGDGDTGSGSTVF